MFSWVLDDRLLVFKLPLPPPIKPYTVLFTPQVSQLMPDCIISKLSELPSLLSHNLGQIIEIANMPMLVKAIEDGPAIAVSDISIGTHNRSSHAYIISTKC